MLNVYTTKYDTLKQKDSYKAYQEDLAFAKELNILRNDFYYHMMGIENISLVNFLYQPLEIMSGDAYSARKIDEHRTFYVLIDGMGKGLSASLSTMIMTFFINHIIDKMIQYDSFSLDILIKESLEYIQLALLDDESLAIDYILFDTHFNKLSYAKFAMPPFLIEDKSDNIIKIKSNNPPLSKWQKDFKIDTIDIQNYEKFLFYSDGVIENSLKESNKTYADFIVEDFKHSFTKEELKHKLFDKIAAQEDDLTMIFINKLNFDNASIVQKTFNSTLNTVDEAIAWYDELWLTLTDNAKTTYRANLTFTELFMNAYEHGNLGIDSQEKNRLIQNDEYFDELKKREKHIDKKIVVKVDRIKNITSEYIVTQIQDDGNGFDTKILEAIFRNTHKFNGRGVYVSKKNSMGIYYNLKGNNVLFLNKI